MDKRADAADLTASPEHSMLHGAALIFIIVLGASLLGILTRPLGFLAAFWPANALLLGLLVRYPHLARPTGWLAAIAGYITADLLTGGSINTTRNELLKTLDHAANHDALTGALMRRAFMERGSTMLKPPGPDGKSVAVLMLDLDHFKAINDRHGHAVGDQALMAFAATIAPNLREGDLFGRLGGEEFGVLMPQLTPAEASAVADRLRNQVASLPIMLEEGPPLHITVSIGLAYQTDPQTSLAQLMAQADAALYQAKAGGRNRVVGTGEA